MKLLKYPMHKVSPVVVLLCLGWFSGIGRAADSAPAWLQTAAAQAVQSYDKKVSAVVLWDEAVVTFNDKGEVVKHARYAVKILNREGKDHAHQVVPYRADSKISDFSGWHISPDGKVRKADKKEIVDVGYSEEAFTDVRRKVIDFLDAQPGSVVGFEYETTEKPFVLQDEWGFQGELPVLISRYTLNVPAGWEARGIVVNHEKFKPAGDNNSYIWELRNLPPVKHEAGMPSAHSLVPWLAVSCFPPASSADASRGIGSWHDLSRWYDDLSSPQLQGDDSITAKAIEITAGKTQPLDKIRAIATWMQKNIRYLDIEIGIGGLKPHAATSVLHHSYGDCKDKVTLMRALLKASGIDSHYVLIYSGDRDFVHPDVPVSQFNHAIIAIKADTDLPSSVNHPSLGKLLFFDPTDSITPVGDLPYYLQGSNALVVKGSEGEMLKMPETREAENKSSRSIVSRIDRQGTVVAIITRTFTGQLAQRQRHILSEIGHEKYQKYLETNASKDVPGGILDNLKLINADDPDQPLIIQFRLSATNYGNPTGNLIMFRPTLLSKSEELVLSSEDRKYPYVLEMNESLEDTIRFELPQGFKVDETPDAEKLTTTFGHFETTYKVDQGALVLHRVLQLKAMQVPKEQFTDLQKFFGRIYNSDQASVVLAH